MDLEILSDAAAELVAIFRLQVLGGLPRRELASGMLRGELLALSKQSFLPPHKKRTQRYAVSTLERWYYAQRRFGMAGLKPRTRQDKGRARALTPEQKKLVLDIRCEYPLASAALILRTLELQGTIDKGTLSVTTLRRFFRQEGVQKQIGNYLEKEPRLRWQAERAGMIFHADVCHGPKIRIQGRLMPTRIHAILDDASRYIVAIQVVHTEKESDMLTLILAAWRAWGASNMLYLDNGATYRGDVLLKACARVETTLLHAKPYDPQARGKMERFWRTLREGCLNYLADSCSLDDVNERVHAFVHKHYHKSKHASLMGRTPAQIWAERQTRAVSEQNIHAALTVHQTRVVNGDGTISLGGVIWETHQHSLAKKKVKIGRTLVDFNTPPWIEYDKQIYPLKRANPLANGKPRPCAKPKKATGVDVHFDPTQPLLPFVSEKKEGAV